MATTSNANRGGRPRRPEFTREQIDAAHEALGREYYGTRAAARLREKWKALSREAAHELLDVARAELREQLSGNGTSPAVALWHGFMRLAFGEGVKDEVRVSALCGATRLLGIRVVQGMGDDEAAKRLLEEIVARQRARTENVTATQNQDPQETKP